MVVPTWHDRDAGEGDAVRRSRAGEGPAQQFQVPLYQRTYSWTKKQLIEATQTEGLRTRKTPCCVGISK